MRAKEDRLPFRFASRILLIAATIPLSSAAQTTAPNEWIWENGSNGSTPILSDPTSRTTLGAFSPANAPAPREFASSWTDLNGNLWLFGGALGGVDPVVDGIWEFDPSINQWAWMAGSGSITDAPGVYYLMGVPSAVGHPGLRFGSANWTDSKGRLWVFGGFGYRNDIEEVPLNDLWMFDPSTTFWTFLGGEVGGVAPAVYGTMGTPSAANLPPARMYPSAWTDKNGRFWLYGGQSSSTDVNGSSSLLTDMWIYDPSAGTWEWVAGSNQITTTAFASAVYGTLGVSSPSNSPGARVWNSYWTDNNGNFWLFSGLSQPNDLWEFNPTTNQWTWMAGSNTSTLSVPCGGGGIYPACPDHGIYGTLGVPAPGNIPGSRQNAQSWIDKDGNFWLFGGTGQDSESNSAYSLNDLWRFNPATNQWAWMGGNSTLECNNAINNEYQCYEVPVFGTLGTPAVSNNPGGRMSAPTWVDTNGNLWLFSGNGLNDTWVYRPSAASLPPAITPVFSLLAGNYQSPQTLTISNGMANASIFYTTDGTTPTSNSTLYTGPITVPATETVQAFATGPGYPTSAVASATYIFQADTPTFSSPAGTYNSTFSLAIFDGTTNAFIYYTTDGSTPTSASTRYIDNFPFTVSTSETVKAIAVANGYSSPVASVSYIIDLPGSPGITLTAKPGVLNLNPGGSGAITMTVTPTNGFNSAVSFACSGLPAGTTCSFSPTTVTPAGAAVTTQLTITVGQSAALRPDSRSPFLPSALALAVCLFSFKRRRAKQFLLLAIAALTFSVASACGGGGSGSGGGGGGGGGTQPVTSIVTVTATSGTIQQTANISLTVN